MISYGISSYDHVNCSIEYMTENGVRGMVYTGPGYKRPVSNIAGYMFVTCKMDGVVYVIPEETFDAFGGLTPTVQYEYDRYMYAAYPGSENGRVYKAIYDLDKYYTSGYFG
jgi:hypothetical protein